MALLFFHTAMGASEEKTRVLIVGDSLSAGYGLLEGEGWVAGLNNVMIEMQHNIEFINESISGDTTASGLARLPGALQRFSPNWVIIQLGANDGLRGLSLDALENNLSAMVIAARERGAAVAMIAVDLPQNYGAVYQQAFAAVFDRVAAQYDVPLLDGASFNQVMHNPDYFQRDGLHPNLEAQVIIQNIMYDFLAPLLGMEERA